MEVHPTMKTHSTRSWKQLFVLGFVLTSVCSAQHGATDGQWRSHGGDTGGTRYADLDQITRDNFSKLQVAWQWQSIEGEIDATGRGTRPGPLLATPLMVRGVLYIITSFSQVAAVDAGTGKTLWKYDAGSWRAGRPANMGFRQRGVAYWSDGGDERIIFPTGHSHLIAVDAKTGQPIPEFGDNGHVDLSKGLNKPALFRNHQVNSPPMICRNVIVVGGVVMDRPPTQAFLRGDVRGFDVRTGKKLWQFHTIPQEGEFGQETWENESWKYTGNTNVWTMMTADEELGYVYLPVSAPTNDYYGGHRPGNNLFGESLVAVDLQTGERLWHFQLVHHPIWGFDMACPPILADITVNGREIKAVALPSKQAFLYVFDRETGEPVWPIEERPVPQGDAPGEWYAATQPFPTKPPAFDQQGVTIDDLIDFTPELRAEAVAMLDDYVWGPFFTPPTVIDEEPDGTQGTLSVPGLVGGTDWNGAGVDPETGIMYVPSAHSGTVIGLVRSEHPRSDVDWVIKTPTHIPGPQGLPLFKPPYGRLVAIDLNAGEILWTVANGDGPQDHPAIAHLNLPPLGHGGRAAPLVTKSLVFHGEGANVGAAFLPPGSGGKMFRAYDKATGTLVGEIELPGGTTAAPISYSVDGTQYIVVAVGWDDMSSEYIALALP